MPVTETAEVVLRLSAAVRQEDGLWVAGCPSLDVYSQGGTEAEAKNGLQEAVELWIDSCLERNTLGEALRELGWYRVPPGTKVSGNADVLDMPPGRQDVPYDPAEYPLEVSIPAYQAALFSGVAASARC